MLFKKKLTLILRYFVVIQGQTFKTRIEKYLEDFKDFKEKIVPFINTDNGKKVYFAKIKKKIFEVILQKPFFLKIFDEFLKNQTLNFPWYVDEIKGIADGSRIPFELVKKTVLNKSEQ